MIGSTVMRYRVIAKLGGGGMGVVYEAEDLELGRRVALKFLPDGLARDPAALERFRLEARAASALNHPHICTIYDVGSHDGHPFLVMERLSGQTVRQAISAGSLSIATVLEVGEQIADALEAAHRAGIVHRDLKPANLFLTERGDAKVLDFGLAKWSPTEQSSAVSADAPTVVAEPDTATGTTLGTVAYMSPEQARGRELDARSDLYSLGAVLYEMATGRPPFSGGSTADLFAAILRSAPTPPSQLDPEIPPRFEQILLKALEKDLELRYQTAAELRADLRRLRRDAAGLLSTSSTAAAAATSDSALTPPRRRLANAARWALAAVGLVASAGLLWLWLAPPASPPVPRPAASAVEESVAQRSIAVLPFVNMSPEREQEFFADGITEELINLLSRIPQLRVISRSSSFSYKGKGARPAQIAAELNVAHVLSGSVRKAGERVRITAQLIEARSDTQLWSQTWDRQLDDIFAVQDEIAGAVVAQLRLTLLGEAPRAREVDPRAYALFLEARESAHRWTPEGFTRAIALYQEVLAAEPEYSAAWEGLARTYLRQVDRGVRSAEEGYRLARAAVSRALALDPDYAPARSILGWIAMDYDRDLAAAAREFGRSLALAPVDIRALNGAAFLLSNLGRQEEAMTVGRYAVATDPRSAASRSNLGYYYLRAGRYDESVASYRAGLEIASGASGPHFYIGLALLLKGDAAAALAEFERDPEIALRLIGRAVTGSRLGRAAEADAALAELIAEQAEGRWVRIAATLALRGESDRAFEWLGRALDRRDPSLIEIAADPSFASLAGDRRWLPFLARVGVAPEQRAAIRFAVELPGGGTLSPGGS